MLDALAAPSVPSLPAGAPVPGATDSASGCDFAELLTGAATAAVTTPDGQAPADAGKDLPDDEDDTPAVQADPTTPATDLMLLWLPASLPANSLVPTAPATDTSIAAATPLRAPAVAVAARPTPVPTPTPNATSLSLDPSTWQAVAPQPWTAPLPTAPAPAPAPVIAAAAAVTVPADATPRQKDQTIPIAAPLASPIPSAPPAIQPARQAFAAAIALGDGERPQRLPRRSDPADQPLTATLQALGATMPGAVTATGDAQHAPMDLTRDTDLGRMIDHIEQVRDQADAGDTRIRLSPDALGTVDVAVRRDGDRVQVHFTAEQPATRTLIADAQPRLQALADARGLKLGDASITGGAGGEHRPDRAPERFAAATLRGAKAPSSTATEPAPDARLA